MVHKWRNEDGVWLPYDVSIGGPPAGAASFHWKENTKKLCASEKYKYYDDHAFVTLHCDSLEEAEFLMSKIISVHTV